MFCALNKENKVEEEDKNFFFFPVSKEKDDESFWKWSRRETISVGEK